MSREGSPARAGVGSGARSSVPATSSEPSASETAAGQEVYHAEGIITKDMSLHERIEMLKVQQAKAKLDRKKAASELKNAQKRKSRVMRKARELSNGDLAEVITMRQENANAKARRTESLSTETAEGGAEVMSLPPSHKVAAPPDDKRS
jgi:hypothetical protein